MTTASSRPRSRSDRRDFFAAQHRWDPFQHGSLPLLSSLPLTLSCGTCSHHLDMEHPSRGQRRRSSSHRRSPKDQPLHHGPREAPCQPRRLCCGTDPCKAPPKICCFSLPNCTTVVSRSVTAIARSHARACPSALATRLTGS